MNRRMDRLSWPEIRERLDAGRRTVVVAFGATEQHGPHLPLATDTMLLRWTQRSTERAQSRSSPTIAAIPTSTTRPRSTSGGRRRP